jgi:alpha-1,2-mannosyltransferase
VTGPQVPAGVAAVAGAQAVGGPRHTLASVVTRAGGALVVAVAALWLEPVMATLGWGQIDLVLMALVLADMCMRDDRWWKGAGVGVAAGMKLTPLIFIPYLVLTRRFRAAMVATAAFGFTVAVSFIVLPESAKAFWLGGRFLDEEPVTNSPAMLPNQSLAGMLARLAGGSPGPTGTRAWLIAAVVTGIAGLLLAAMAHRRGYQLIGTVTCAVTGLLVSPVSWDHHWVWVLPLLIASAALLRERLVSRRGAVTEAAILVLLGLLFFGFPRYFPARKVPHFTGLLYIPGQWHGVYLLTGNAYVLAGVGVLLAVAVLLARDYPARFSSMTASTAGSSGVVIGRNRAATVPSGRRTNFSKFHWMSPASPSASGTAVSSS